MTAVLDFWATQEATVTANPDWASQAGCRGVIVDAFYPVGGSAPTKVLDLCNACPVRAECLAEDLLDCQKLHTPPDGIRGGMPQGKRRELFKEHYVLIRQLINVTIEHEPSDAAYSTHRRRDEEPCTPCRLAHAQASVDRDARKRGMRIVTSSRERWV